MNVREKILTQINEIEKTKILSVRFSSSHCSLHIITDNRLNLSIFVKGYISDILLRSFVEAFFALLRRFLFFYDLSEDNQRLYNLLEQDNLDLSISLQEVEKFVVEAFDYFAFEFVELLKGCFVSISCALHQGLLCGLDNIRAFASLSSSCSSHNMFYSQTFDNPKYLRESSIFNSLEEELF